MLAMRLRHSLVLTTLLQLFAGDASAFGQPNILLDLTSNLYSQYHHHHAKRHFHYQHSTQNFDRRSVDGLMARGVADILNLLERRQDTDVQIDSSSSSPSSSSNASSSPSPASPPASGDGNDVSSSDIALWNEQTSAVCLDAVRSVEGDSSNPSGISVCYNLPFLDEESGVFQAELRMYNVSAPVDEWKGVVAADIALELSFTGASAQIVDNGAQRRRRRRLARRQNSEQESPEEMKILSYIGQIDEDVVKAELSLAELQPILLPSVVLSARNPENVDISTSLSSSDSSFLNGVFALASSEDDSPSPSLSDEAARASASDIVASVVADVKVEIPGVTLGVFPIGMIVTLVWTVLFLTAVGYGTVTRMRYRNQFRRRMRRDAWRGVPY